MTNYACSIYGTPRESAAHGALNCRRDCLLGEVATQVVKSEFARAAIFNVHVEFICFEVDLWHGEVVAHIENLVRRDILTKGDDTFSENECSLK